MPDSGAGPRIELATSANAVSADEWNACAGANNPFALHQFYTALEDSGSAAARTGWQPAHVVVRPAEGAAPDGIVPGYAKSHSRGEYVFDHGWADAFERAGGRYYPKLQLAAPFTPATGPRLLAKRPGVAPALIGGAEAVCRQHDLSSAHATFLTEEQLPHFQEAGWLIRYGEQFHWFNRGYGSFEDFLSALSSRKRKTIRRERRTAEEHNLEIVRLTGSEIGEADWDDFWVFYQDTGARKWGTPYLTRAFFSLASERMADRLLLLFARHEGAHDCGRAELHRRRLPVRPLLGCPRRGALPAFRAMLLSGNRLRD